MLVAPSVTPESWHDIGHNPALRRYRYNVSTFELLDYEQYFVNLTAANAQDRAQWQLEYRASEEYGVKALTTEAFADLPKRLATDPELLERFYVRFFSSRSDLPPLDAKMKRKLLCLVKEQSFASYELCKAGL